MSRYLYMDRRGRVTEQRIPRVCAICREHVTSAQSTQYLTWGEMRKWREVYKLIPRENRNKDNDAWLVIHMACVLETEA